MKKVREGYKITELGEIPSDWEIKELSELYIENIRDFGSFSTTKLIEYVEEGVPYLRAENFRENKLILNSISYITDEVDKLLDKSYVYKGNILFTKIGNIGCATVYKGELGERCNSNATIAKIKIDEEHYNLEYISYFLNSQQCKRQYVGSIISTPPRINMGEINKFKVAIPALSEQEKIASILSTVDEQIDNIDGLIEKNKELKKGLMQQLLTKGIGHKEFKKTEIGEIPEGWQNESLGDMVNFEGGTQPPKKYFSNECLDGMIRLIQIRDYKSDKFKVYVPKELCRRFCDKNDIMIGRYGPPIFQILRGLEGAYNVALIKATPINESLDREYLYYFLSNEKLFNLIDSLSQRTSGQTGIDMEVLKAYKMPIPTKEEQGKIVSILSQIDKKIESYKNKKQKLEELKIGLMQQLLTGKVRVI